MNYSVYKHTFPNGKVYIGITRQKPEIRWGVNGSGYLGKRNEKHTQPSIARAINKYGWENVSHEVLYSGLTKQEAESMEIKLIAEYKSNKREFGYNISNGGNTIGTISEDTKNKISKSLTGENHPMYGKHRSKKTKNKISKSLTGENHWNYGKHLSEDTKMKLSESNKGQIPWSYGKHLSEEHKKKLSESCKNKGNKLVKCIETGKIYKSVKCAAQENKVSPSAISRACNNKNRTCRGCHWEFIKNLGE